MDTPVGGHTVYWKGSAWSNLERCTLLARDSDLVQIEGTVIGLTTHAPFEIRYHTVCNWDWLTKRAEIQIMANDAPRRNMVITADQRRQWFLNGEPLDHLAGCSDIDLGFSPVTNTLPIRRLKLEIGAAAEVVAAWVKFPELVMEPLAQWYSRLGEWTYRYESASGFSAMLEVDAFGLVTPYERLWERLQPR